MAVHLPFGFVGDKLATRLEVIFEAFFSYLHERPSVGPTVYAQRATVFRFLNGNSRRGEGENGHGPLVWRPRTLQTNLFPFSLQTNICQSGDEKSK